MTTSHPPRYTNNVSGNLNRQQEKNKYKLIDLDDLDVEMISPNFLQNKTLKKPLRDLQISTMKTKSNGFGNGGYSFNDPTNKQYPQSVIFKKDEQKPRSKIESKVSLIDASALNIKPAFKNIETKVTQNLGSNAKGSSLEIDKNTILAALLRKGMKPQITVKHDVMLPKEEKKAGPAEAKLKAMIGKTSQKISKQSTKKQVGSEIGEEINEEFEEYGNQSFQKMSGVFESIRESIAGESLIKESIAGESIIKESIRQSYASSSGNIKESIREDIRESIQSSSRSLKEEIIEQISASNRKSKQSIEEVYQQIFEEESLSNSVSKSQSKFRKSQKLQSDSLSQSASKSFRMKTNIAKSLKFAEELSRKDRLAQAEILQDKKFEESMIKERLELKNLHEKVGKILGNKPKLCSQSNKNLYYNFKVEINRLLVGDFFESKLKKLVSFLNVGDQILPNRAYADQLEHDILARIMYQITALRQGKPPAQQVQRIKHQYQSRLVEQLRIQQVNLRAEMNQKLSEKQFELKKMIAELESHMMARRVYSSNIQRDEFTKSQEYEVESDYSIESDNISWKADLWQLLPEYEKKKLYQKQTGEVTKFLASVMINQIKEEALERSLDISFEFPEDQNSFDSFQSYRPYRNLKQQEGKNQKSLKKKENDQRGQYLSDLPKLPTKKAGGQEMNSEPKEVIVQAKFESIRRDEKIKTDVIKVLSEYKSLYLKKKQEVIRNILKVASSKDSKVQTYLYSSLQQITVLPDRDIKKEHHMYVRAYEEELIMNLLGIYTRSLGKKPNFIEEEMRRMYDRLVVVSQITTAQRCTDRVALDIQKDKEYNVEVLTKDALRKMELSPCAIQIISNEGYMELRTKKEEVEVRKELVESIVNILSLELARELPKRKK